MFARMSQLSPEVGPSMKTGIFVHIYVGEGEKHLAEPYEHLGNDLRCTISESRLGEFVKLLMSY